MKVLAGVSPFDDRFKLEVEGEFKLEFFRNDSRRVALGVDFETPDPQRRRLLLPVLAVEE